VLRKLTAPAEAVIIVHRPIRDLDPPLGRQSGAPSPDPWDHVAMPAPNDVDLAPLQNLSGRLCATVLGIEDRHRTMATPCAGWDLSALVDHVTGGNWFTIRILNGWSTDDAMNETMKLFEGTGATSEQAVSSVAEQLTAFGQVGVLDRIHHHVAGDLTGREVLRLRLHDLIVHTWDLDQTLAPPASIPPDLVRWGLSELAGDDSLAARHFDLATASTTEVSEPAEAAYLHRFGRQIIP